MINQILILFLIVCVLSFFNLSRSAGYTKFIYWILCIALIFFAGLRDGTKVTDYQAYEIIYESDDFSIEPTFVFIRYLCKHILSGSIVSLMFVYALLAIPLKFIAISRYSEFVFMSLAIWIGNLFLQQDFTQIRASVAIGFFLLSLESLYNRDAKKYFVYVLIACLFHISSLLLLPLWFLSGKQINRLFWFGLIVGSYIIALLKIDVVALIQYVPIEAVQSKFVLYQNLQMAGDYSANIFSVLQLIKILIFSLILYRADVIANSNKYVYILLKINALAIIALPLFSLNIAAALRIMEFYGIVEILLFPMLLYIVEQRWLAKIGLVCFASFALYMRIFLQELITV